MCECEVVRRPSRLSKFRPTSAAQQRSCLVSGRCGRSSPLPAMPRRAAPRPVSFRVVASLAKTFGRVHVIDPRKMPVCGCGPKLSERKRGRQRIWRRPPPAPWPQRPYKRNKSMIMAMALMTMTMTMAFMLKYRRNIVRRLQRYIMVACDFAA